MRLLPAKWWVKIDYRFHMGRKCNLKNPRTFNEKLCWLKVYHKDNERTKLVDKYAVRQYIADKLGQAYVVPLLGVWKRFDEIDFNTLPEQFVLKPNHTSGDVFICEDKSKIDKEVLRETVNKWMRRRYYHQGREREYKRIKPRIIAEEYLTDQTGRGVMDYKFLCFNGKPRCLYTCQDRRDETGLKINYYDMQWQPLPIMKKHNIIGKTIEKPAFFDEMVHICELLSNPFPFVRLDLYETGGKIYFGEFTFCPDAGVKKFVPEEWDKTLGDWLELPYKTDEYEGTV